jgi:hypothetical protein
VNGQPQIPFDFAQGRLSTHHPKLYPQTEERLGPLSLRMTVHLLIKTFDENPGDETSVTMINEVTINKHSKRITGKIA